MTHRPAELLLHYLDARVHAQIRRFKKPLTGTLAVGVRRDGRTVWWIARFGGAKVETGFLEALPVEFDAGVAVDEQTALWILGVSKTPGEFHMITGDDALWRSFKRRYLEHHSMVSLRAGGGL